MKKIVLLYLLWRLYTVLKLQKKVNFEILANVPPFLWREIFLGLGHPIGESGPPAYLKSLKMLPINFSSQKTCRAKFYVILTLCSGFTVILRFFRKKSTVDISSLLFPSSSITKKLPPPTLFKISGCALQHSTRNKIVHKS